MAIESLFPSFFLGGFECASHVDRSGARQDLLALTEHDRRGRDDYALVRSVGLRAARDGVHWHACDHAGRHDFRPVADRVAAARQLGLTVIWDLFHYGYPDDLDPRSAAFVDRFAAFAAAFARWLRPRAPAPRWYVPLNEPSFFAWAAGEAGWFAPFLSGHAEALKVALVRAAMAAIDAIRAVDADARFIAVDPLIHVVAPGDKPDLAGEAARFRPFQFEAWDMLIGRAAPELGGRPDYLDVIGVNYYLHGQWEFPHGRHLALDDPRRRAFREMLREVDARYGRPIVVTETGCCDELRSLWLRLVVDEALAALAHGVDLRGMCLYPIIDSPAWGGGQIGDFIHFGLWDLVPDGPGLRRVVHEPMLRELRRQQRRLGDATGALPG